MSLSGRSMKRSTILMVAAPCGFRQQHANTAGISHGGVLMALADTVLGSTARADRGQPVVTIRVVTEFIGPCRLGEWLVGRAWVTRHSRVLSFVEGELRVRNRLIMTASGVFRVVERPR